MENMRQLTSPPKRSPSRDHRSVEAKFMMASLQKGAATLTRKKMLTTFRAFAAHAKLQRYGDVDPATVTKKQLSKYVSTRIEAGITARTIQNEVSHLRRALRGAGRGEWIDALTNTCHGSPYRSQLMIGA